MPPTPLRVEGGKRMYILMLVKNDNKPPMIGNGHNTTYKDGNDWGIHHFVDASRDSHYVPKK